jgi:hypothetical protein
MTKIVLSVALILLCFYSYGKGNRYCGCDYISQCATEDSCEKLFKAYRALECTFSAYQKTTMSVNPLKKLSPNTLNSHNIAIAGLMLNRIKGQVEALKHPQTKESNSDLPLQLEILANWCDSIALFFNGNDQIFQNAKKLQNDIYRFRSGTHTGNNKNFSDFDSCIETDPSDDQHEKHLSNSEDSDVYIVNVAIRKKFLLLEERDLPIAYKNMPCSELQEDIDHLVFVLRYYLIADLKEIDLEINADSTAIDSLCTYLDTLSNKCTRLLSDAQEQPSDEFIKLEFNIALYKKALTTIKNSSSVLSQPYSEKNKLLQLNQIDATLKFQPRGNYPNINKTLNSISKYKNLLTAYGFLSGECYKGLTYWNNMIVSGGISRQIGSVRIKERIDDIFGHAKLDDYPFLKIQIAKIEDALKRNKNITAEINNINPDQQSKQ